MAALKRQEISLINIVREGLAVFILEGYHLVKGAGRQGFVNLLPGTEGVLVAFYIFRIWLIASADFYHVLFGFLKVLVDAYADSGDHGTAEGCSFFYGDNLAGAVEDIGLHLAPEL